MAVVAQLSVNLAAQTQQFSNGLKSAGKDLKGLEKQAASTKRVLNSTFKGIGQIGGKLGLGGAFGGMLGGFTFANFAKESLKEHAKSNNEMQASLKELDETILTVKKNFGAWLADVGGANSIIQGFTAGLKKLSGEDIDRNQALVNAGGLETAEMSTASSLQEQLRQAKDRRAALEAQHRPDVANLDLRRQWGLINEQINILDRRLGEVLREESELFGKLILPEDARGVIDKAIVQPLMQVPDLLDMGVKGLMEFGAAAENGLGQLQSMLNQAEADAKDFMKGFKLKQGQKSPIEIFTSEIAELQRLLDRGFIDQRTFDLEFLDAQNKLSDFAGLNDPLPGRVAGVRRGSADAFSRIAAFEDKQNSPVQRTLDETLEIAKRQLRALEDLAAAAAGEGSTPTIDTKP